MRALKTGHLNAYLTDRAGQTRFNGLSRVKLNPRGVNKEWRFIGGILRGAFRNRIIPKDVTGDVVAFKTSRVLKTLPSLEQLLEVVALIQEKTVADFVRVAILTGARFNELAHLKFVDIDFTNETMRIVPDAEAGSQLKNEGACREFAMPVEAKEIFRKYRSRRGEVESNAYIFNMADGRPFKDYPNIVYRRLTKAVRQANRQRKKAGLEPIPEFTVHSLRHWFISWALTRRDNPLTEAELIKIVGHADFSMIRRTYLHIGQVGDTARKMRDTILFGDKEKTGLPTRGESG
jgi:integrase